MIAFLLLTSMPSVGLACRCSQETLQHYFTKADVVAEVDVVRVDKTANSNDHEIFLRLVTLYKGSLDQSLLTPKDGSNCGLMFNAGERWWVFASRSMGTGLLHAHSCNGTRIVLSDFVDVKGIEVAVAFSHLAAQSKQRIEPFIPVECWQVPRSYHGPASDDLRRKIVLARRARDSDLATGVKSPNGAYHFTVMPLPQAPRPPYVGRVWVDAEDQDLLEIQIYGLQDRMQSKLMPRWINEKIIQLHIVWNRNTRAEALIDVEAGQIVFLQSVYDGKELFANRKGQCQ